MRNKSVRSYLRTKTKRFQAAIDANDQTAAEEAYRDAARAFDKAASKGVIHKNKAAHKKSRLARRLTSI